VSSERTKIRNRHCGGKASSKSEGLSRGGVLGEGRPTQQLGGLGSTICSPVGSRVKLRPPNDLVHVGFSRRALRQSCYAHLCNQPIHLANYCGGEKILLHCGFSIAGAAVPSSDPFVEHWHRTWVRRMTWNSAVYHGLTSALTLQFVRRCYIDKEAQLSPKTRVMLTQESRGVCEKARLL